MLLGPRKIYSNKNGVLRTPSSGEDEQKNYHNFHLGSDFLNQNFGCSALLAIPLALAERGQLKPIERPFRHKTLDGVLIKNCAIRQGNQRLPLCKQSVEQPAVLQWLGNHLEIIPESFWMLRRIKLCAPFICRFSNWLIRVKRSGRFLILQVAYRIWIRCSRARPPSNRVKLN